MIYKGLVFLFVILWCSRDSHSAIRLIWIHSGATSSYHHGNVIIEDPNEWIPKLQQNDSVIVRTHKVYDKWTSVDGSASADVIFGFSPSAKGITRQTGTYSLSKEWLKKNSKLLIAASSDRVTVITYDWITGNFYYADDALNWIMMSTSSLGNENYHRAIVTTDEAKVTALAVAPISGYLFWSVESSKKIERSNLYGGERLAIISEDVEDPSSLVVDENSQTLLWLDTTKGRIERCDFSGENREILIEEDFVKLYHSIAIYQDWMLALSMNESKLFTLSGVTHANLTLLQEYISFIGGSETSCIKMISEGTQPVGNNTCELAGCQHLCVNDRDTFKCLCSEGYILQNDSKSCIETILASPSFVTHGGGELCIHKATDPLIPRLDQTCYEYPADGTIAVNYWEETVWMTDDENSKILSARWPDQNSTEPVKTERVVQSGSIGGLTVDWTSGQVYWTNTEEGTIRVADKDGKFNTQLLSGLTKPTAIVVDPINSFKLFWVDDENAIQCANFDGSNSTHLVNELDNKVGGIVIDHHEKRLYWTETASGEIYSILLSGADRTWHRQVSSSRDISGVAVFQDFIVASMPGLNKVEWLPKDASSGESFDSEYNQPATDVISFSDYSQPNVTGPCSDGGGCDQICLPLSEDTRECLCSLGYSQHDTTNKCEPAETKASPTQPGGVLESFLLIADISRQEIYQVSMDEQVRAIPIKMINPVAVDYDEDAEKIYWSDLGNRGIWEADLKSSTPKLLAKLPETSMVYGIAVDIENKRLYYTDSGLGEISWIPLSGVGGAVKVLENLDKPRAITIDVANRYLFWSETGTNAKIIRIHLDRLDDEAEDIMDVEISHPNGISLDRENKMVYWCDAQLNKIVKMTYDGDDKETLLEDSTGVHFIDLTYHGGSLYLTDWESPHLREIKKDSATGDYKSFPFGPAEFEMAGGILFIPSKHTITTESPSTVEIKTTDSSDVSNKNNVTPNAVNVGEKAGEELDWKLIGTVVGVVGFICILIIAMVILWRMKKRKEEQLDKANPITAPFQKRRTGRNNRSASNQPNGGIPSPYGPHSGPVQPHQPAGNSSPYYADYPRLPSDSAINYGQSYDPHQGFSNTIATPFGYPLSRGQRSFYPSYGGSAADDGPNYGSPLPYNPTIRPSR